MKKYLLLLFFAFGATSLDVVAEPSNSKIPDWLIEPYTKKGWPSTFAKFKDRMPELQKYRVLAAEKAASDRACTEVVAAEISGQSTYSNMQFFVDCSTATGSYKRFRFSESDLNNPGTPLVSEGDKALSRTEAITYCAKLIENNANYPSTVEINYFGADYRKFETLGNTKAYLNFKAKNAFGLKLKYKAICTFGPSNPNGEIVIRERTN